MTQNPWCCGTPIELFQILDARERRADIQHELLALQPAALISFTLNIAGPVKAFPFALFAFETGLSCIKDELQLLNAEIYFFREIREHTGYEAFFLVSAAAEECKKRLLYLEDSHPLGRLFDMDVLKPDGTKISRESLDYPGRTCLLCDKPAFLCGRSRTHTAKDLAASACSIIEAFFLDRLSNHIGMLMQKALFYEVNTTLKPGLVDLKHNGSHKDMNLHSFVNSAYALTPYFIECTRRGMQAGLDRCAELHRLFTDLRPLGMDAERLMRQASGGANTHKGMVFSGGIFCFAIGYLTGTTPTLLTNGEKFEENVIASLEPVLTEMLTALLDDYHAPSSPSGKSHGMELYQKYGVKGIRGEAAKGFPSVLKTGLPYFNTLLKQGYSLNDAGCLLLLHYIADTEDTNLISRSSYKKSLCIRKELTQFLKQASYEEQLASIPAIDRHFVAANISPGGSADLLALTYFLYFFTQKPFCLI